MKHSILTIILFIFIIQPLLADESNCIPSKEYNFDWEKNGPLEFIELLKKKDSVPWYFVVNADAPPCENNTVISCSFQAWQYTVMEVHENWILFKDIPKLIELLEDDTPCANVAIVFSSFISKDASTIGHEAAYLIEGFRKGKYPPDLNSSKYKYDKQEIIEWWKSKRRKNKT